METTELVKGGGGGGGVAIGGRIEMGEGRGKGERGLCNNNNAISVS